MDQEMELARAIKGGTLELICPEMELLVCPAYDEVALKGTGVIRTDHLGRLYFRMVSPFSSPRHKSLFGSKLAGQLYDPEDYVMLRAIDENGREWRSNHLRIEMNNQLPVTNYQVHKHLSSIISSEERRQIDFSSLRILVPRVPDLPFDTFTQNRRSVGDQEIGFSSSLDHHDHVIGGTRVSFRREDADFVSVSAVQDVAFLPTWPGLMCHALSFAVAQTLLPAVIIREFNDRIDLSLHSGPFWRYASMIHSPVPFTDLPGRRDFWKLVELFFVYVDRQQSEPNPLLDELDGIRRGSQGSIQTACLTLAVGVESIARLLLYDEFSSQVCRPQLEPLLTYLDSWEGDATTKERAKGAVSRLAEVGAASLLYAWAAKTGTDKKLVNDWKSLRNPKAHGKTLAREDGWTLFCSALELLNRMIAYAIAYDGKILMTSQPGWGIQQ